MTHAASPARTTTLDVRSLAPRERHSTIFATFHGLNSGEALELVNDHDPRPLYYQLQSQAPDTFEWNYLDVGPETWRVQIKKLARSHGSNGQCCGSCGGA